MTKFKTFILLFIAGNLYALGFPSFIAKSLLITPIIGFSILLYTLFDDLSLKSKIAKVLSFNIGFNILGYYWIAQTLIEFGSLPYPIALFLNQLHALIIAPYLYAFLFLIHIIQKKIPDFLSKYFSSSALILSASLCLFEYFITGQFQSMIGQPFIIFGASIKFFAAFAGIPIFSFFSYLICFEILRLLKYKRVSKFSLCICGLFVIINILNAPAKSANSNKIHVRLVQANISNFLKTESESGEVSSVESVINRYKDLSLEKYVSDQKEHPDLIIWPETAYPYPVETSKNDYASTFLPYLFSQIAKEQNSNLFIGGYNRKALSRGYYLTDYNSQFFINRSGNLTDIYHKQVLIPFGETLPFGPFNEYLSKKIDTISFFARGEKNNLFTLDTGHSFINSICYEILSPEFIRKALNEQTTQPHGLINITNDSWYGDTAEPHQHLFLASWRAIEFNLPIIRSTNTGISALLDSNGQPGKTLGIGVSGNLDAAFSLPDRKPTFYQKWGIGSFLLIFVMIFIFHLLVLKYQYVKKDSF